MTEEQDITLGEIYRLVQSQGKTLADLTSEVRDRHHELSNQMVVHIGPIAVLKHQMKFAEENLVRLDGEVREMGKQAAKVSVLGTLAALVVGSIPWPWKRG